MQVLAPGWVGEGVRAPKMLRLWKLPRGLAGRSPRRDADHILQPPADKLSQGDFTARRQFAGLAVKHIRQLYLRSDHDV
jgi:hypothetical protein